MESKNKFELLKINMNESQELKNMLDLDYLTYILAVGPYGVQGADKKNDAKFT